MPVSCRSRLGRQKDQGREAAGAKTQEHRELDCDRARTNLQMQHLSRVGRGSLRVTKTRKNTPLDTFENL